MKQILRVASDWHLEFYDYKSHISSPDRDINDFVVLPRMENEKEQILLIAGDVLTAIGCDRHKFTFESLSERFKQIYVIMGNHEHYKHNFLETRSVLEKFYGQWNNIKLLENDVVNLTPNTALFGATLWTDFGHQKQYMNYARYSMADFSLISYGDPNSLIEPVTHFTPEHSAIEHSKTIKHLEMFLKDTSNKTKIVMTHHAPSFLSNDIKFAGSPLSPAFCSNLDDWILDTFNDDQLPQYWIHGHCHNASRYSIWNESNPDKNVEVVCNPYGYYQEKRTGQYNPNLTIVIE